MKIYKHKDYDEYIEAQINKYNLKRNNIWVMDSELNIISKYIKKYHGKKKLFGICHGVRTGYEVEYLMKKIKKCKVIGTEIAENVNEYVYKMDFNKLPDEWYNTFDFIYSNSFDHSNDPENTLDEWMRTLRKIGICMIHRMATNENKVNDSDCFAATLKEYKELIERKYRIRDIIKVHNGREIICITH